MVNSILLMDGSLVSQKNKITSEKIVVSIAYFFDLIHSLHGPRPERPLTLSHQVVPKSVDMHADGRRLSSELRAQGYKVLGGEALDTHGWTSWRTRTDDLLAALFPLD